MDHQIIEIRVATLPHGRLQGTLPGGEIVLGTNKEALITAARERLATGRGCQIRFVEEGKPGT